MKKRILKLSIPVLFIAFFSPLCISANDMPVDSSCTGGGVMYICGKDQAVQALADADNNCSEGFSMKKLIDVCSPNMQEYTIF